MSSADELERLARLHQDGFLSEEEFRVAKTEALGRIRDRNTGPMALVPQAKPLETRTKQKTRWGCMVPMLALLGGAVWFLAEFSGLSGVGRKAPVDALADRIRQPQVMADEDWVISAGGSRWLEISLPNSRPVLFEVTGKKHSGKGFAVYRVSSEELKNLKNRKQFRHDPSFHGEKVTRFRNLGRVPAGSSAFVVVNTENILDPIVVRVRVVVDPAER
jgi:hypothetical protein